MSRKFFYFILAAVAFTACKKSSPVKTGPAKSTQNSITAFSIDSVQVGTSQISVSNDSSKITVNVLQGSNLTAVLPHITISDKAIISPALTVPVNFTANNNQVTYTVTSESGAVEKWYVQVKFYANLVPLALTGDIPKNFRIFSDLDYNAYLTRNEGWNGGDGCYSHLLPDSSILWTFQDSFIGTVGPNRNRSSAENIFARNAGVIELKGSINSFIQLNPGQLAQSQTWIQYNGLTSNDDKEIYWPDGAQVLNDSLQMILNHLKYNSSGGLDLVSIDIAIFSLHDMKLHRIIPNHINIKSGSDLYKDDGGYTYIYGDNGNGLAVARVANNDLRNPVEYYTNTGWTSQPDGKVILTDRPSIVNIFKDGSTYYYVTQNPNIYTSKAVSIYQSNSPIGPWINKRNIYYEPSIPNVVTYNASLHQELSRNGELVLSYNTNPTDGFGSNFNAAGSADKYRPYFVRIYNWK